MSKPSTFSVKFKIEVIGKIKELLEDEGFSFSDQQYSFFKAQSDNATIIPYNKGKLVIQGPGSDHYYRFMLDKGLISPADEDKKQYEIDKVDDQTGMGIDESGKGDFFGPLVVCACFVDQRTSRILGEYNIRDSKKVTKKKISEYASVIKNTCSYELVEIGPEKYNNLYGKFNNLNRMLAWAHSRSAENLLVKLEKSGTACESIISDQFAGKHVLESFLMEKTRKVRFNQYHKAERVMCVAAASIVARDHFVKRMERMSNTYGVEFPLGCSDIARSAAREFIQKHGPEKLPLVCKTHFKTYNQVLNEI